MPYFLRYHVRVFRRTKRRDGLQAIYRLKNLFKQKTRKRKFKLRVKNDRAISPLSRAARPIRNRLVGLRADNACRLYYANFIAAERALMMTKRKVSIRYRRYPNFFVTKKSSKSRMGKGKGKIWGRLMKVRRGEVIFDLRLKNIFKARRAMKAVKATMPTTTVVVFRNRRAEKVLKNFFRARPWARVARRKRKKLKKHLIQKRKIRHELTLPKLFKTSWRLEHLMLPRPKHIKIRTLWHRWICDYLIEHTYRAKLAEAAVPVRLRRRGSHKRHRSRRRVLSGRIDARGGAIQKNVPGRWLLSKWYIKKTFVSPDLPDADGYTGYYRAANSAMKRRIAREIARGVYVRPTRILM